MYKHTIALAIAVLGAVSGAATPSNAQQWNNGPVALNGGPSCSAQAPDLMTLETYLSWYGEPNWPPPANTIYYMAIRWKLGGRQSLCNYVNVRADITLPANTSLALSQQNQASCFYTDLQGIETPQPSASCSRYLFTGTGGTVLIRDPDQNDPACSGCFTFAPGTAFELQFPVISSTPSTGTASATVVAGYLVSTFPTVSSLSLNIAQPRTPRFVGLGSPTTTISTAVAEGTLDRAGTIGEVVSQISNAPLPDDSCSTTASPATVTMHSPTLSSFRETWNGLAPDTQYNWRFCYKTGGALIVGPTQTLRTAIPIVVPNVIGLGRVDAERLLGRAGLCYWPDLNTFCATCDGSASTQNPSAGTPVDPQTVVSVDYPSVFAGGFNTPVCCGDGPTLTCRPH